MVMIVAPRGDGIPETGTFRRYFSSEKNSDLFGRLFHNVSQAILLTSNRTLL